MSFVFLTTSNVIDMNPLTVLILTAGIGSRLQPLTNKLNKTLVSINNRPVISYIIDNYPADTTFVIGLGFDGDSVKQFLLLAYPFKQFQFFEVDPFIGPGSGLGFSFSLARQYLQRPFIFHSCDSIITNSVPSLDHNWLACSTLVDCDQYRTLELSGDSVVSILEKSAINSTHCPYIGVCGIYDFDLFWDNFDVSCSDIVDQGESAVINLLLSKGLSFKSYSFEWFDTGNFSSLASARSRFESEHSPVILEKDDESIWFVHGNVLKFSRDSDFISQRIERSSILSPFVPSISASSANIFSYPYVDGKVLSSCLSLPLFDSLLSVSSEMWSMPIPDVDSDWFTSSCLEFYKDKTFQRNSLFYKSSGYFDSVVSINGSSVPTLSSLLESLDWNLISDGLPSMFHGDFHFENILYDQITDSFKFIDWRQNFAGDLFVGDRYYDFAKLLHGIIVSHQVVSSNGFSVDWLLGSTSANISIVRSEISREVEAFFVQWLADQGYSIRKVYILCSLIYINIAPLHHHPYSLFLHLLGHDMLAKALND